MNDLAEKALNGLNVARRQVGGRPFLSLSVAGFVVSCVIVVAGGQVGAARATRPLVNWLGLQDTHGLETTDPGPGAVDPSGPGRGAVGGRGARPRAVRRRVPDVPPAELLRFQGPPGHWALVG